jgi:hypothetical protein
MVVTQYSAEAPGAAELGAGAQQLRLPAAEFDSGDPDDCARMVVRYELSDGMLKRCLITNNYTDVQDCVGRSRCRPKTTLYHIMETSRVPSDL